MGCFALRFSHDGRVLAAACADRDAFPIIGDQKICTLTRVLLYLNLYLLPEIRIHFDVCCVK